LEICVLTIALQCYEAQHTASSCYLSIAIAHNAMHSHSGNKP